MFVLRVYYFLSFRRSGWLTNKRRGYYPASCR